MALTNEQISQIEEEERLRKRIRAKINAETNPKNPWLAGFLSLIIPGAGQLYLGQYVKAILIFLTCWLVLPWIYGVLSAFKTAQIVSNPKNFES